jgi:hypothetical protein
LFVPLVAPGLRLRQLALHLLSEADAGSASII